MRQTIVNTKGAYSGFVGRTLESKIKYDKEKEIASSFLDEGISYEPSDNEKGGIIVFSTEVNAKTLSSNAIVNWLKQKFETIKNNLYKNKKIDAIGQKHNLVGWTVGKYLSGRYTAKNGKAFGEDSLSLEIIGINFDTLISVAEDLCKEFGQEAVLVKDYSSNRVFFVEED